MIVELGKVTQETKGPGSGSTERVTQPKGQ